MYAHDERMEVGSSFLLESDFVAFNFSTADASISIISERYRKFYGAADACAMSPPPEARQIILQMLRSYGTEMVIQLERNSADYLEGGKFAHATGSLRTALESAPCTNDCMERVFGIRDCIATIFKTASFWTTSVLCTMRYNHSIVWLYLCRKELRHLLVKMACARGEASASHI